MRATVAPRDAAHLEPKGRFVMQELPLFPTLESARLAAAHCVACDRAQGRIQVVFGHGNPDARLMLVGETPSATDDETGKPFTGPAGRLLDRLFAEIGISRADVWITNLTRCFAGTLKDGRVENRPVKVSQIKACRTWTDIEIRYVNPNVLLAVGAPAAKHLIGPDFKLQEQHGQLFERPDGRVAIGVVQPAYVMRLQAIDEAAFHRQRAQLVEDLRIAANAAGLVD
jgi:uracil-DNA glycosylase